MFASTILVGQAGSAPCSNKGSTLSVTAAALRPADVLLAITRPRAGEMVTEVMPSQSVTVTVDYWGPRLVAADQAHNVDEYHLVFFLDTDDAAYVGSLTPAPRCTARMLHSASPSATFDHVMRGSHTVSVMLVGSNDVSVNPPVAASITFVATDTGS